MDQVVVTLDVADIARAAALARRTFERWKSKPGYYRNTPDSHFRGKLGELAVSKWLDQRQIAHHRLYELVEHESEADLVLSDGTRVEVKTWALTHWKTLGRCIAVHQVAKLRQKADRIAWCVANLSKIESFEDVEGLSRVDVQFMGVSTMEDVLSAPVSFTGPQWGRKVENHQIAEDDLRSVSEMLAQNRIFSSERS